VNTVHSGRQHIAPSKETYEGGYYDFMTVISAINTD